MDKSLNLQEEIYLLFTPFVSCFSPWRAPIAAYETIKIAFKIIIDNINIKASLKYYKHKITS